MKTFKEFREESDPVYSTKQFTKFGKSNYGGLRVTISFEIQ